MCEAIKTSIREYGDGLPVEIWFVETRDGDHLLTGEERWAIVAMNEGGYNYTEVDLEDVAKWIKANRPDLL